MVSPFARVGILWNRSPLLSPDTCFVLVQLHGKEMWFGRTTSESASVTKKKNEAAYTLQKKLVLVM